MIILHWEASVFYFALSAISNIYPIGHAELAAQLLIISRIPLL
jgi:hypothetical protein